MSDLRKITLFAMHTDENHADYDAVCDWLARWQQQVHIVHHSSGGWEHIWDLLAPPAAIAQLPSGVLCDSDWASPQLFAPPAPRHWWQRLINRVQSIRPRP
jgi:hypothetical protein